MFWRIWLPSRAFFRLSLGKLLVIVFGKIALRLVIRPIERVAAVHVALEMLRGVVQLMSEGMQRIR